MLKKLQCFLLWNCIKINLFAMFFLEARLQMAHSCTCTCFLLFLQLFCRMRNRSLVSEHKLTCLVGRSVDWSILTWVVNFCLYFRWPMHNLTWRREKCRRMVRQMWNITNECWDNYCYSMSTACGASIFLFEWFLEKT